MKFAYLIEPPFNYVTADGQVAGHDVDIAQHIFRMLEIEKFELVEAEFSELLPGLSDDRWSMTTGLFSTKERSKNAIFSRPIWSLPDGLLVSKGNPELLTGYSTIAQNSKLILAVIRDQFQHRSAISLGVPEERLRIFNSYLEAASSVRDGSSNAYASVGRAHSGFIEQNPDWEMELVDVPFVEKPPAFGSFAFSPKNEVFKDRVDNVLNRFLGSDDHFRIGRKYGFTDAEVRLIAK